MERALEMGKVSAVGSFQMLIGVAGSTIIMAVGTIILTRLLSPTEYGLYAIAMIPSLMINLFRDWGVNSAMTKNIASLRATNKDTETRNVVIAGVMFEVVAGATLSLLSFFLAELFASLLQRPASSSFISIMSITVLSGSLLAAAQASFVGFERMELNSFTLICQAIVKTVLGPLLILLGYGVLGAVIGYTFSMVAAGLVGSATVYFILFRPLHKSKADWREVSRTLKPMLRYGLPLSVSAILLGVLTQFYAFMMPSYASDSMIGNYQAAVNFAVLLTFFTIPIGTVLFPAFAKLDTQNERELLKTIFASSVKYTSILLVPATLAVMALATPIVNTLFGGKYAYAPFFLTLYVVGNLYAVLGNLSLGSFLTGLGETKLLMKQAVLTLLIGLPLAFLLIPQFGIVGIIVGNLVSGIPSMIWALHWVWRHYGVKAEFTSSAKIFIASGLAAVVSFLVTNLINATAWIQLVLGFAVFLVIYVLGAPAIGAVYQSDIDILRSMFSGLSVISRLVDIPLRVAEKTAQIRSANKKGRVAS